MIALKTEEHSSPRRFLVSSIGAMMAGVEVPMPEYSLITFSAR